MRIKYLRVPNHALTVSSKNFARKYNLEFYNWKTPPIKSPAFFYGIYLSSDLKAVLDHRGLAVIVWAGTDAVRRLNNPAHIKLLNKPNIKHLARSDFIAEDLRKAGLDYKQIRFIPTTPPPNPKPLGDSVYCYYGFRRGEAVEDIFNYALFKEIEKDLPDIKFLPVLSGTYSKTEIYDIYEKCFINIRLVAHDALSNTVCEMGMMGRRSVWNDSFPGAYRWKNKQDVIDAIIEEHKNIGKTNTKLVEEVTEFLDIGTDWLDTDYWT